MLGPEVMGQGVNILVHVQVLSESVALQFDHHQNMARRRALLCILAYAPMFWVHALSLLAHKTEFNL